MFSLHGFIPQQWQGHSFLTQQMKSFSWFHRYWSKLEMISYLCKEALRGYRVKMLWRWSLRCRGGSGMWEMWGPRERRFWDVGDMRTTGKGEFWDVGDVRTRGKGELWDVGDVRTRGYGDFGMWEMWGSERKGGTELRRIFIFPCFPTVGAMSPTLATTLPCHDELFKLRTKMNYVSFKLPFPVFYHGSMKSH